MYNLKLIPPYYLPQVFIENDRLGSSVLLSQDKVIGIRILNRKNEIFWNNANI